MKKFINKVQDLSQKAEHLKKMVEAAPAQAAHLRDTVLMTAAQLQRMRHDVQASVTGLRADSDDRLAQALREINDSSAIFLEAGYALTGVDMELSPVQRLIVHFEKIESVPEPALRALLAANSGRQTVYALLAALAKADGVSEKVHLTHLTSRELIVHVGPTPSVRLCWSADAPVQTAVAAQVPTTPVAAPVAAASSPPPLSAFASSSYFEQRSPGATPRPAQTSPAPPSPEPAPGPPPLSTSPSISTTGTSYVQPTEPASGGDWRKSALDRFKKMPDASKYRR